MGHKHSEETKKKIGLANKDNRTGVSNGEKTRFSKGHPSPKYWNGQKFSKEHREKLRKSAIKRGFGQWMKGKKGNKGSFKKGIIPWNKGKSFPQVAGEKCHLWKGGITPTYALRRRGRLIKNGGSHTLGEWENLKAQYNWTCPHCKIPEPKVKLTKDHIIPITKGGSSNIENIQPLCTPCNSRKNNH